MSSATLSRNLTKGLLPTPAAALCAPGNDANEQVSCTWCPFQKVSLCL